MIWALFIGLILVLAYQYQRGLISTADLDTGVILLIGAGLVKL